MPGLEGDYLDALLEEKMDEGPPSPKDDGPGRLQSAPNATTALAQKEAPRRKERFTVQIDPAIVEELRDAAVWFLMSGERASVAGLVETALRNDLQRLKEEHMDGADFPPRPYDPPPGRRL